VEPDVSVVVASFSGEAVLRHCLESLEPQAAGAEVIVATDVEASGIARLEARYPGFRFHRAPRGTSVFRLRVLGIDQARGRLVVLTEDHCTAAPGWLDALRASHGEGRAIVGGPVDNGRRVRAYDWALYLCEYAAQMPPLRDGPARALSGVNVSYPHDLLDECRGVWRDGFAIELMDYFIEGFVPVAEIPHDSYHLEPSLHALIGRRTGKRFRIGDRIEVQVVRVDKLLRRAYFLPTDSRKPTLKSKRDKPRIERI